MNDEQELFDLKDLGFPDYFVTKDFRIWSNKSNRWIFVDKTGCALLTKSPGHYKRVSAKILFSNAVVVPHLLTCGFVKIFIGSYLINSKGNVYSTRTAEFLIPSEFHKYLYVNCNGRYILLHRLVAKTFISNPEKLPEVNHIDGNKLNVDASNLEWCTRAFNMKHAYQHGYLDTSLKKARDAKRNTSSVN